MVFSIAGHGVQTTGGRGVSGGEVVGEAGLQLTAGLQGGDHSGSKGTAHHR